MDGKELKRDADEPEVILFALLHHLKALAAPKDGSLTGERTPTLHGQVKER